MTNNQSKHIAFKCTYNNGGEGRYAGFNGTCSNEIIKYNIENRHIWCSNPDCPCSTFYRNNFEGKRPIQPCSESIMLSDEYTWSFSAGYKHTIKSKGEPLHIRQTDIGNIVILTTRFPNEHINNIVKENDTEDKRRIIGFFRIGKILEEKDSQTTLISDGEFEVKLPLKIAKQTYFWDNYSINSDKELWGTGLFRYMGFDEVKKMLSEVLNLLLKRPTELVLINKIERLINLI
jgi:hypothetical protein